MCENSHRCAKNRTIFILVLIAGSVCLDRIRDAKMQDEVVVELGENGKEGVSDFGWRGCCDAYLLRAKVARASPLQSLLSPDSESKTDL